MPTASRQLPMMCPHCGHTMNHHSNKVLEYAEDNNDVAPESMLELHSCPECGASASRSAV